LRLGPFWKGEKNRLEGVWEQQLEGGSTAKPKGGVTLGPKVYKTS